MFDLTVDVGVLMVAFGASDLGDTGNACSKLARKIESARNYSLAWDKRGLIKYQYEEKLKRNMDFRRWLAQLGGTNKIKPVLPTRIDRGTLTLLKEKRFYKEDFKYVRTSAATECKILVSHDPHYSTQVKRVLGRLSVKVRQAQACLALGDR